MYNWIQEKQQFVVNYVDIELFTKKEQECY